MTIRFTLACASTRADGTIKHWRTQKKGQRVRVVHKTRRLAFMWLPADQTWQYRVLDQLPSGIDVAQLERARRMTPTERVEAMVRLVALGEELRRGIARRREAGLR